MLTSSSSKIKLVSHSFSHDLRKTWYTKAAPQKLQCTCKAFFLGRQQNSESFLLNQLLVKGLEDLGLKKENATFVQNSPQFVTVQLWQKYGEKREGF